MRWLGGVRAWKWAGRPTTCLPLPPPPPPAQPLASLSRVAHFPQEEPTPTASSQNLLPFWKDQKFTSSLHGIEPRLKEVQFFKKFPALLQPRQEGGGGCWIPTMHFNGKDDGGCCGKSQFNLMQCHRAPAPKAKNRCNVGQQQQQQQQQKSQWEISIQSRAMGCTWKNSCTL